MWHESQRVLNLAILFLSYALLVAGAFFSDEGSAHNLILLSAALVNTIALVDIAAFLYADSTDVSKLPRTILLWTIQTFFLIGIIGVDIGLLHWGPVPWIALAVALLAAFLYLVYARGPERGPTTGALLGIIAALVVSLAVGQVALANVPQFLAERWREYLHLLLIPLLYVFVDVIAGREHRPLAKCVPLDVAVLAAGVSAACIGKAVNKPMFEAGAAAVLLMLGNHFYLLQRRALPPGGPIGRAIDNVSRRTTSRIGGVVRPARVALTVWCGTFGTSSRWRQWASRLWDRAEADWQARGQHESLYRRCVVMPAVTSVIRAEYQGPARVIDIGCGDGKSIAEYLTALQSPEDCQLVLVDQRRGQLNACRGQVRCRSARYIQGALLQPFWALRCRGSSRRTIFLAEYVLQELPSLHCFFGAMSLVFRPGDAFIALIPHPAFAEKVVRNTMRLRGLSVDWDWAGPYPIRVNGKVVVLPHFQRGPSKIKEIASEVGLACRWERALSLECNQETEAAMRDGPYYPFVFEGPSSVLMFFERPSGGSQHA